MKHRIYNFPLTAEEKQILHRVHRSTIRAQPDRSQGPSWGPRGGSSTNQAITLLLIVGGQGVADEGVALPSLPCPGRVGRPCCLTQAPRLGCFVGRHVWKPHFSRNLSNLGFTKEKPANAVWSMESMRFLSV